MDTSRVPEQFINYTILWPRYFTTMEMKRKHLEDVIFDFIATLAYTRN